MNGIETMKKYKIESVTIVSPRDLSVRLSNTIYDRLLLSFLWDFMLPVNHNHFWQGFKRIFIFIICLKLTIYVTLHKSWI